WVGKLSACCEPAPCASVWHGIMVVHVAMRITLFALVVLLAAAGVSAQTAPAPFQPAPPAPDAFDWIQLKSGEWLKGELIALYDGKLEFDSDELEKLTLDWDDVREGHKGRIRS